MLIKDLLIGAKVRTTKSCIGTMQGKTYEIDETGQIGDGCTCTKAWELVEPSPMMKKLGMKIPKHVHTFKKCAECGEQK